MQLYSPIHIASVLLFASCSMATTAMTNQTNNHKTMSSLLVCDPFGFEGKASLPQSLIPKPFPVVVDDFSSSVFLVDGNTTSSSLAMTLPVMLKYKQFIRKPRSGNTSTTETTTTTVKKHISKNVFSVEPWKVMAAWVVMNTLTMMLVFISFATIVPEVEEVLATMALGLGNVEMIEYVEVEDEEDESDVEEWVDAEESDC